MTSCARRLSPLAALAALIAGVAVMGGTAPPAAATPSGPAWVVSVGDSYVSGEAGRWAGNTHEASYGDTDALGPTAYDDAGSAESIPGCHRSRSAEIAIGGVPAANLACAGARVATSDPSGGDFKPGLDFYDNGRGHVGQAAALQAFAADHRVSMVVVSIGGNDFGFASVVRSCVRDYLLSPVFAPNYCQDDASVTAQFTPAAVGARVATIRQGLLNVRTALARDGYADASYAIVVQNYPSPLPASSQIRYGQSGYGRQSTGGCGLWDRDLDWAATTMLPTIDAAVRRAADQTGLGNVRLLDVSTLLDGRRLCEKGVGKLYETSLSSWRAPGAVDGSEWVENIRTASAAGSPYYVQESLHPNYWGQLALRGCVRQVHAAGVVRGGRCTIAGPGVTAAGEPVIRLS